MFAKQMIGSTTYNDSYEYRLIVANKNIVFSILVLMALVAIFPRGIGYLYNGVAIDVNKVLYALAIFATLVSCLKFPNQVYDKIFYLFLALPFIMLVFHLNPLRTFFGQFYNILFYYSAYFIGRHVFRSEYNVYLFAKIISVLSLFFISMLFYDWVSGQDYINKFRAYDDLVLRLNVTSGRGQGVIDFMGGLAFKGWSVGQAKYSMLAVALLFYVSFVFITKKKNTFDVVLFASTMAMFFVTVLLTHTRTGLVLLAIWILFSVIYILLSHGYKVSMVFIGLLILGIVGGVVFFNEYLTFLLNVVSTLHVYIQDLFASGSVKSIRADALQKTFAYIADNPLTIITGVNVHIYSLGLVDGVSFRRTVDLPYILTVFLEYGVLGVMFNFVLFAVAIKVCILSFKRKDIYIALPMSLFGLILHMSANNVLQLYWYIYLMFGGMVSYIYMNQNQQQLDSKY